MPWIDPPSGAPTPTPTPTPSPSPTTFSANAAFAAVGIIPAPQIDAPFRLDSTGQLVTVPQGSQEDINAQIYNVVICPQGAKIGDPTFGIPSPLGAALPLNLTAIVKTIQTFVPLAVDVSAIESAILVTSPQETTVTVTAEVLVSA